MEMLQNVCENCVRILEEEKHRQFRMIVILWKKWKQLASSSINHPHREKPKTVRTPEYIAAVAESVCEAPLTSIHRRSQQLNISETSLRRILHKDLSMAPYKYELAGVEAN